jgi:dCTP deaminase
MDPPHGRRARHDRALRARPGAREREGRKIISYGTSSYGYDIRCAPEFKVFTNIHSTVVDPKNFDEKSFVDFHGDSCIIPPNSFALARTVEYFRIPRNVLTICLGKSTYARCGIIVNVTPFEPEWEGYVTLEFSNTTPLPARIYAGEGCAQVLFFESDKDDVCEVSYKDRGGKYQGQQPGRDPAPVVGNAGIDQVDGDALDRQRAAPAGLAQAQHQCGPVLCQQRLQPDLRLAERRG